MANVSLFIKLEKLRFCSGLMGIKDISFFRKGLLATQIFMAKTPASLFGNQCGVGFFGLVIPHSHQNLSCLESGVSRFSAES